MNIAIIGAGLIGGKRAKALESFPEDSLRLVCDVDAGRAATLASENECAACSDWKEVIAAQHIDAVVVATINSALEPIAVAALRARKHVLCEKPLGRNAQESARMVVAAEETGVLLKTGFNHRFHPGIWKAKELAEGGGIGEVFAIRARYGHGGRPGMEHEWRASKQECGGGELLDQGVHVIDLIRWFGGEVRRVYARVETKFWDMDVEDNAFAILDFASGATAQFHVSWTNWRNIFSLEVFGRSGYLAVNGLGGSYGQETLEWGRRKVEGGRPDIDTFEFTQEDNSWREEWREFRTAILEKRAPIGDGRDGLMANRVIAALYESSASGMPVEIR